MVSCATARSDGVMEHGKSMLFGRWSGQSTAAALQHRVHLAFHLMESATTVSTLRSPHTDLSVNVYEWEMRKVR